MATYGTVNAENITSSTGGVISPNITSLRNRIINGAMNVNQYGFASATANINGVLYFIDRFIGFGNQAGKFTMLPNLNGVSPPTGFTNYAGAQSSSAYTLAATDIFTLGQNIEGLNITDLGWGTSSAKTVTLSFWAYSSLTGTFGGSLRNNGGGRSYPFNYSIPSANTWTYVSITIPGDTSGTWLTTNGIGIIFALGLGVGTTYSGTAGAWASANYASSTGAVSVVSTNNATFYITGVQLEVGTQATSFDYRPYGTELALCQRYCLNVNSANCNGSYNRYAYGECNSTTQITADVFFPVQMRTYPALTTPAASQFCIYTKATINAGSAIAIGADGTNINAACVNVTTGNTVVLGNAGAIMSNGNNTSYLLFTAEL